ncbi:hypothetical protein RAS1_14630 [Phycisphaerae bacterium RAS1]|nr:hypothetical protein RAS1_14630 [Phycisphaerae bacterium RAS1]
MRAQFQMGWRIPGTVGIVAVAHVAAQCGWRATIATDTSLRVRSRVTWRSWGMVGTVYVQAVDTFTIVMISCNYRMAGQLIDLGDTIARLRRFEAHLRTAVWPSMTERVRFCRHCRFPQLRTEPRCVECGESASTAITECSPHLRRVMVSAAALFLVVTALECLAIYALATLHVGLPLPATGGTVFRLCVINGTILGGMVATQAIARGLSGDTQ